jgi:hypothetical protein
MILTSNVSSTDNGVRVTSEAGRKANLGDISESTPSTETTVGYCDTAAHTSVLESLRRTMEIGRKGAKNCWIGPKGIVGQEAEGIN